MPNENLCRPCSAKDYTKKELIQSRKAKNRQAKRVGILPTIDDEDRVLVDHTSTRNLEHAQVKRHSSNRLGRLTSMTSMLSRNISKSSSIKSLDKEIGNEGPDAEPMTDDENVQQEFPPLLTPKNRSISNISNISKYSNMSDLTLIQNNRTSSINLIKRQNFFSFTAPSAEYLSNSNLHFDVEAETVNTVASNEPEMMTKMMKNSNLDLTKSRDKDLDRRNFHQDLSTKYSTLSNSNHQAKCLSVSALNALRPFTDLRNKEKFGPKKGINLTTLPQSNSNRSSLSNRHRNLKKTRSSSPTANFKEYTWSQGLDASSKRQLASQPSNMSGSSGGYLVGLGGGIFFVLLYCKRAS